MRPTSFAPVPFAMPVGLPVFAPKKGERARRKAKQAERKRG